jgi:stage II sporulation protein D
MFKLATALALLKREEFNKDEHVTCRNRFLQDGRVFTCEARGGHGAADLRRALAVSCCVYFYSKGQTLSPQELIKAARLLGFGEKGARAGEISGVLRIPPDRKRFTSMLVGEGPDVEVTCAQAARAVRRIALGVNQREMGILADGMRAAVLYGTAKSAGLKGIAVAGKTGTASDLHEPDKTHSWFAGFAPYRSPEIAVAVFMKRGKGSTHAAPLARKVLELYFSLKEKERGLGTGHGRESSRRALSNRGVISTRRLAALKDVRVRILALKKKTMISIDGESPLYLVSHGSRRRISRVTVKTGAGGIECATPAGETSMPDLVVEGEAFIADGRRLSGRLRVKSTGAALLAVLTLPLERYLYGVVASELPPEATIEAKKAQAVCSRSYALACRGRHRAEGYDYCDSTHCQNFQGVPSGRSSAATAVRATEGLVLSHRGRIVEAFFHSTCGGRTAQGAEAFGRRAEGIVSVPDAYCTASPHYRWSYTISRNSLARALSPELRNMSTIRITRRGPSGRVLELVLAGNDEALTISGYDFWMRAGRAFSWGAVRSTLFDVSAADGAIRFTGRGLGHGAGLCQWGSMEMARRGRTYQQILRHFFPGCSVTRYSQQLQPRNPR